MKCIEWNSFANRDYKDMELMVMWSLSGTPYGQAHVYLEGWRFCMVAYAKPIPELVKTLETEGFCGLNYPLD